MKAAEIMKAVGEMEGEMDFYMEDGILYHALETMPFDLWDSVTNSFRHATGREYWDEAGQCWRNEYEPARSQA